MVLIIGYAPIINPRKHCSCRSGDDKIVYFISSFITTVLCVSVKSFRMCYIQSSRARKDDLYILGIALMTTIIRRFERNQNCRIRAMIILI